MIYHIYQHIGAMQQHWLQSGLKRSNTLWREVANKATNGTNFDLNNIFYLPQSDPRCVDNLLPQAFIQAWHSVWAVEQKWLHTPSCWTDSFIVQGSPLRQENFDLPIALDCEITHSRVGAFMGEERCRQPAEKLKLNLCQQKIWVHTLCNLIC